MPRLAFAATILTTLASIHLVSAQWWMGFSGSCSSWEGQFGTTDGSHGTAILAASCFTPTGASVDSTLDLNTCVGMASSTAIEYPSSGLFNDGCIVLNVPNSLYNPFSQLSPTDIEISCLGNTPGTVGIITLDLNNFVGNNNGVLACGDT